MDRGESKDERIYKEGKGKEEEEGGSLFLQGKVF